MKTHLQIGTRGSQLALWQANWVKGTLEARHPGIRVELTVIKTKGDKILDVPLARVGGKGLFVKEIEEAILDGRTDLAVHSMKDMPADIPPGLVIGAVPPRENPLDVLISRSGCSFERLAAGSTVGTSSLRRAAQVKARRPDMNIVPLRGNLDTRLRKLETENLDAVILAAAGVKRLELAHRITEYLDEDIMLPAVGQGALCIEIRAGDSATAEIVGSLDDLPTRQAVAGERAFLHRLEGGCQVPIAAHGRMIDGVLHLQGLVADLTGQTVIREHLSGSADAAAELGTQLAERLRQRGADSILSQLKESL